jgi:hypothetical protein
MVFDKPSRGLFVLHDVPDIPRCIITRLNTDSFQVMDTWTIDRIISSFRYYSHDNKIYYLSNPERKLYEYDPVTAQETKSVSIASVPGNLVISPDGDWIYVCSGDYPKMGPLYSDDPDYWNQRRGVLEKVNRGSFKVTTSQTTYSGPQWIELGSSSNQIIVSNAVVNEIGTSGVRYGEYEPDTNPDLWIDQEVFNASDLSLVKEIQTGGMMLSSEDGDLVIAGGSPEYGRLPQLINLQSGIESILPFPSEGYFSNVGMAVSSSLNKAFLLLDEGAMQFDVQPRVADIQVIDLTDMSWSIYETQIGFAYWQIEVDEVGDQLILFSMSDPGGLVSVSPIP